MIFSERVGMIDAKRQASKSIRKKRVSIDHDTSDHQGAAEAVAKRFGNHQSSDTENHVFFTGAGVEWTK